MILLATARHDETISLLKKSRFLPPGTRDLGGRELYPLLKKFTSCLVALEYPHSTTNHFKGVCWELDCSVAQGEGKRLLNRSV
jgi:hypothetical protein